jgi:hypothetical protein
MSGYSVSPIVKEVQVKMCIITMEKNTPIRTSDESLDTDDGNYNSGSDAEPEVEEDE